MRYKVYAGTVGVTFGGSTEARFGTKARFHWVDRVLVYDSYGDSIEGEETDGILAEPAVELANKEAGSFSGRVPYRVETRFGTVKNPYYDRFVMGETWVMVTEDEECIFFGRVTECELEFNLDKSITADGIMNELDKMQTKLDASSYGTTAATGSILTKVFQPDKRYKGESPVNCMERGNVTVENKTISTEDNGDQFGSYWSILTTYLLEHEKGKDGYLRLRLANDPGTEDYFFYYDYLREEDVPQTDQSIRYGVNMLDFTLDEKRGSDLVNSVTAHGIETKTRGWWIFKKTTYNNIASTYSDSVSIGRYGLISRHIYVDGKKSTDDSLYEAAKEELENYKQEAEPTLTIKAFDLKDAGESADKLGFLLRTHVVSAPHDVDRWMVCTKVKLPLDGPDNKEFTFGLTSAKLSKRVSSLHDQMKAIWDAVKGLIGHMNE